MYITTTVTDGTLYVRLKSNIYCQGIAMTLKEKIGFCLSSTLPGFHLEEVKRALVRYDEYLLKVQVLDVDTDSKGALKNVLKIVKDMYTNIIKQNMATDEKVLLSLSIQSYYSPNNKVIRIDKDIEVRGKQDPSKRCGN